MTMSCTAQKATDSSREGFSRRPGLPCVGAGASLWKENGEECEGANKQL
jgi:hypothetical protein